MSDFTLHAGKARVLSFPLSNKNLCAVRSRMRFRSGLTAARFLLGLAAGVSLFWVSRSLCQQKGLLSSGRHPGGYTISHDKLRVPGENGKGDRSTHILNFGTVHSPARPRSLFQSRLALSEEANFLFGASFRELFASVFGVNRADEASPENHSEEAKNPFSDALRQTDEKSTTGPESAASSRTERSKSTEAKNTQGPVAVTGAA